MVFSSGKAVVLRVVGFGVQGSALFLCLHSFANGFRVLSSTFEEIVAPPSGCDGFGGTSDPGYRPAAGRYRWAIGYYPFGVLDRLPKVISGRASRALRDPDRAAPLLYPEISFVSWSNLYPHSFVPNSVVPIPLRKGSGFCGRPATP